MAAYHSHRDQRQHRNGHCQWLALVSRSGSGDRLTMRAFWYHPVDPHGFRDVLDLLFAQRLVADLDIGLQEIIGGARDHHPAGGRLQPACRRR